MSLPVANATFLVAGCGTRQMRCDDNPIENGIEIRGRRQSEPPVVETGDKKGPFERLAFEWADPLERLVSARACSMRCNGNDAHSAAEPGSTAADRPLPEAEATLLPAAGPLRSVRLHELQPVSSTSAAERSMWAAERSTPQARHSRDGRGRNSPRSPRSSSSFCSSSCSYRSCSQSRVERIPHTARCRPRR
jgi:hypothetical protein